MLSSDLAKQGFNVEVEQTVVSRTVVLHLQQLFHTLAHFAI